MCFIIRILSPFHLDIQTMPILNFNCFKNAKSTWSVFHSSQLKWSLNCVVFASSVQTQSVIWFGRHRNPRITPYLMVLGRCLVFQTINCIWEKNWVFWSISGRKMNRLKWNFLDLTLTIFCVLGQLIFRMGIVWMFRWNWLKILNLKHKWKSKIWLLEQK